YYLLSLSEELEFRDNVGAEFAQGSNDETECFTQYDYCCKVKGNSKNYEDIRNMIKAYIFNEVGSYWIYSFIDISTYRDNFRQKIYIKKEKEECVCVMTNIEHEKMGNIKLEMNIWLKCDAKQDRVRKMDVKITSKSDYIGDFGREMSELLKDVCMMHHFPIKLLYFKKENGSGEVDSEAKQIVNCLY
ncbi:MAG: hypothetical protein SFT68_00555, partial [Rickettsiaceae bacterium]|nr:hypothetical protein [Rickettsiaceae bacterium]